MQREQGKVIWFNASKGYGFLQRDDGQKDIFCHFSQIQAEGYKSLREGQLVEFDVAQGNKGLEAQNIKVL